MDTTVSETINGITGILTFTANTHEDLSGQDVPQCFGNVFAREVRRCTEIVAVALLDKQAAALAPPPNPERPPTQLLHAGTTDPRGRVVVPR